jgi:hypothetical protein
LFRRKSELPHDIGTLSALDKHKRTQEYLPTTPDQLQQQQQPQPQPQPFSNNNINNLNN